MPPWPIRLEEDAPSGYALLAKFQSAALMVRDGDPVGAAKTYKDLAQATSTPALYRDLADILSALAEVDSADPADLTQRMARIIDDNNPWRFSAREISALAALRAGDKARARDLYDGLATDSATPASLRQRAQAVALHLKD